MPTRNRSTIDRSAFGVSALVLILGVLTVVITALVGFGASDIRTCRSILETATSLSSLRMSIAADHMSVTARSAGNVWRRMNLQLHTPLMDKMMLGQLRASQSENDTLAVAKAPIRMLYAANATGFAQGILLPDGSQPLALLYHPVTQRVTVYGLSATGSRILPPIKDFVSPSFNPLQREWFQQTVQAKNTTYWSAPYLDVLTNQLSLTASVPVREDEGHLIGVVACDVLFADMMHVLNRIDVRSVLNFESVQALLVSTSGVLMGSTVSSDEPRLTALYNTTSQQSSLPTYASWSSLNVWEPTAMVGAWLEQTPDCYSPATGQLTQSCALFAWYSIGDSFHTLVAMERLSTKAMNAPEGASPWAVVLFMPAASPIATQLSKLLISGGLVLFVVIVLFAASVNDVCSRKARNIGCAACCRRQPPPSSAKASIELHEWRQSRASTPLAPVPRRSATASILAQAPAAAVSLLFTPQALAVISVIVLAAAFGLWGGVLSEYDNRIVTKSSALANLINTNVHVILDRPKIVVRQLEQIALLGQIPYTSAQMMHPLNVTSVCDRLFFDFMVLYDSSLTPIQGVLVGYPNGDSYGIESYSSNGYALRFRNVLTSNLLRLIDIRQAHTGALYLQRHPGLSLPYDVTTRTWYMQAVSAVPATPIYSAIYPFQQSQGTTSTTYGSTISLHLLDSQGNLLVLGTIMTLEAITTIFNNYAPDAGDGLMFLAETAPKLPLVASTVSGVTGCNDGTTTRSYAVDLGAQGSAEAAVVQRTLAALAANCTLCNYDVGTGLQQLIAAIIILPGAGINWVFTIAYYRMAFLRDIVSYDNAIMIVAVTCIWLVTSTMWQLSKTRHSTEVRASIVRAMSVANLTDDTTVNNPLAQPTASQPPAPSPAPAPAPPPPPPPPPTSAGEISSVDGSTELLKLLQDPTLHQREAAKALAVFEDFFDGLAARLQAPAMMRALGKSPSGFHVMNPLLSTAVGAELTSTGMWDPTLDPILNGMRMIVGMPVQPAHDDVDEVVSRYSRLALAERHPTKLLALLFATNFSRTQLMIARLATSKLWRWFMALLAALTMALVAWEEDMVTSQSTRLGTHIAETILVSFHLFNWCVLVQNMRAWQRLPQVSNIPTGSVVHLIIGRQSPRRRLFLFHSLVLWTMIVDIICRWFIPYTTGPDGAQLALPIAAALRPLLMLVYSPAVRSSMAHLATTLIQSQGVFSVLMSLLLVVTLLTVAIMQTTETSIDVIGEGFSDVRASVLTIFTFLCTEANYLDVVALAMKQSKWLLLYFGAVTFIGIMLLVSLLIASFQTYYSKSYAKTRAARAALRRARTRIGLFIAFRCLRLQSLTVVDTEEPGPAGAPAAMRRISQVLAVSMGQSNHSMMVKSALMHYFAARHIAVLSAAAEFRKTMREFDTFSYDMQDTWRRLEAMRSTRGCDTAFLQEVDAWAARCKQVHANARQAKERMFSDLSQFVQVYESNRKQVVTNAEPFDAIAAARQRTPVRAVLLRYFDDKTGIPYSSLIRNMLKIHCMLLALSAAIIGVYGRIILFVSVGLFALEVTARIYAEGWRHFWTWPRLQDLSKRGAAYAHVALRADTLLAFASVVILILSAVLQLPILERVGTTLPVIRLFTSATSRRLMVFGVISRLPDFMPLILLQMVVMYLYTVIGCWWFAGQFVSTDPTLQYANFDTFPNAVCCLMQMMSSDSWQQTMYMAFQARANLYPAIYFLSFVIVFVLMFTNVVIGIIVDAYQAMSTAVADAAHSGESGQRLENAFYKAQLAKLRRVLMGYLERRRARRQAAIAAGYGSRRSFPRK